ncbi:hypothetical protein [Embleya sp. MST-111070]
MSPASGRAGIVGQWSTGAAMANAPQTLRELLRSTPHEAHG